jgi:hypothetical protein
VHIFGDQDGNAVLSGCAFKARRYVDVRTADIVCVCVCFRVPCGVHDMYVCVYVCMFFLRACVCIFISLCGNVCM